MFAWADMFVWGDQVPLESPHEKLEHVREGLAQAARAPAGIERHAAGGGAHRDRRAGARAGRRTLLGGGMRRPFGRRRR